MLDANFGADEYLSIKGGFRKIWRKKVFTIIAIALLIFSIVIATHIPNAEASHSAIVITDVTYHQEFAPGETVTVTITIRNNGCFDARNIMLSFHNTKQLSVIGINSVHIRRLGS